MVTVEKYRCEKYKELLELMFEEVIANEGNYSKEELKGQRDLFMERNEHPAASGSVPKSKDPAKKGPKRKNNKKGKEQDDNTGPPVQQPGIDYERDLCFFA